MPLIYVRTKPGRIAREAPKGNLIPEGKYVPVQHTPYIERLLSVHGDIEARQEAPASGVVNTDGKPGEAVTTGKGAAPAKK
jgi:hypothetical protein